VSTTAENARREAASESRRATQRAEGVFRNVGHTASTVFARAREETEDIWAEARDISRGRFGRNRPEGS
jgi:cell division septum initiation protein DivIVA